MTLILAIVVGSAALSIVALALVNRDRTVELAPRPPILRTEPKPTYWSEHDGDAA